MVPVNGEAAQLQQTVLEQAVGQAGNRFGRPARCLFGLRPRVIERAARRDGGQHGVELRFVALLDAAAHKFALLGRAVFHQPDQGQGRFAFAQIVPQVLADLGGVASVVEHVVDQLERGAERAAVFAGSGDLGVVRAGDQRAQFGSGFEQLGGLGADHEQVARFGHVRVVHVQQLQHLAFGDHVGGVGQDLHDAHAVQAHHHLERARVEEVADQHRGGIAEQRVGGLAAAAHRRFVDDVVMQQRCGVDEFDDGGQLMVRGAPVAIGIGQQQHQYWTDALAAGTDDVLGDLVDQRDFGMQPLADHRVDGLHIGRDRLDDGVLLGVLGSG